MALNPPYNSVLNTALNGWQEYPTVATEERAQKLAQEQVEAANQQYEPIFVGQEKPIVVGESQPDFSAANRVKMLQNVVPADKVQGVYDSVFGPEKSELEKASVEHQMTFKEMFDNRRKSLEQQRTAESTMAKYNALGNLLTTMVQPIGWAAGGGKGVTAGTQPYDERQYLEAFNRAVKANDDLRNLGFMQDEYKLKLAEDKLQREAAQAAAALKRQQDMEDYIAKSAIDTAAKKDVQNAKYDREELLATLKGSFKVSNKAGLPVEDRILLKEIDGYQRSQDRRVALGLPLQTFPEYLKERGLNVTATKGGGETKDTRTKANL